MKKALSLFLCAVMLLSLFPAAALAESEAAAAADGILGEPEEPAEPDPGDDLDESSELPLNRDGSVLSSGTCGAQGDNLTWTLYDNGELVIEGEGAMADYWSPYGISLSVKRVRLGNGITSLGRFSFRFANLTEFQVEAGSAAFCVQNGSLYSLDRKTLLRCPPGLQGVFSIPSGTSVIGDYAFFTCTALTDIVIPEGVTRIGEYAFSDCSGLSTLRFPRSLTSIDSWAFSYSGNFTAFQVEDGNASFCAVDGILYSADRKTLVSCPCGKSGALTIPDGVTTISQGAFYQCSQLTSVTLPDGLNKISSWAFNSCSNLTKVNIPESVTSMDNGGYIFSHCNLLKTAGPAGGGYNIEFGWKTEIPRLAFAYSNYLTDVTIPKSIRVIGDSAFEGCESLTAFEVENGSLSYCSVDGVLYSADGKTLVAWPGGRADVTILNGVTTIGRFAFAQCNSISSVELPDSIIVIDEFAFHSCGVLRSICLPQDVRTVGWRAFGYCTALASVTIKEGLAELGEEAFTNCTNLKIITIPTSLTTIGNYAFYACNSLTDVYYGGTQEQWNAIDFGRDNTSLTAATVHIITESGICGAEGDNLRWALFNDCDLVIEGRGAMADYGANTMPWFAFRDSLTSVTMQDGLTDIGSHAFTGCSNLSSVKISGSVIRIGEAAFSDCNGLTDVYYSSTRSNWNAVSVGTGNGALKEAKLHLADSSDFPRDNNGNYLFSSFEELEILSEFEMGDGDYYAVYTGGGNLVLERDITLPSWLTIQGVSNASIIVPLGVNVICHSSFSCNRLIVNGSMEVYSNNMGRGNWADSLEVNGTLYVGTMCIWVDARQGGIAEGEVIGFENIQFSDSNSSYIGHNVSPSTEDELREVIGRANSQESGHRKYNIQVTGDITLHQDCVVLQQGISGLYLYGSLTVPEGIVLDTVCNFSVEGHGKLFVNGTLIVERYLGVQAYYSNDTAHITLGQTGQIFGNGNLSLSSNFCDPAELVTGIDTSDSRFWIRKTNGEWQYLNCKISNIAPANPVVDVTLTYDANGGTGAPEAQLLKVGETLTVSDSVPTREQASFLGWAKSADARDAQYQPGDSLSPKRDLTLYAVWLDYARPDGVLPAGLKTLEDEALAGCGFRYLRLPEGMTTLGSRVFADSARLLVVYIPSSVTAIARDALEGVPEGLLVLCEADSYAEYFACKHGLRFETFVFPA